MDSTAGENQVVLSLDSIIDIPVDMIPADQAADLVRRVLRRGADQVPVDVARFGSAI